MELNTCIAAIQLYPHSNMSLPLYWQDPDVTCFYRWVYFFVHNMVAICISNEHLNIKKDCLSSNSSVTRRERSMLLFYCLFEYLTLSLSKYCKYCSLFSCCMKRSNRQNVKVQLKECEYHIYLLTHHRRFQGTYPLIIREENQFLKLSKGKQTMFTKAQ